MNKALVAKLTEAYLNQRVRIMDQSGPAKEVTITAVKDGPYTVGMEYTAENATGSFAAQYFTIEPLDREPTNDELAALAFATARRVRYHLDHSCRVCNQYGMRSCEKLVELKEQAAAADKRWMSAVLPAKAGK